MKTDDLPAVQIVQYASFVTSTQWNGIPRGTVMKLDRSALISARDLVYSTIQGLLKAIDHLEAMENRSVLANSFSLIQVHINVLSDMAALAFPGSLSGEAFSEATSEFLETLVKGPFIEERALSILGSLEKRFDRFDALNIRTAAASKLLRIATQKVGIDLSEVDRSEIRRSIIFPPEMKQAAVSILSYFSEIVERKYPQCNVGVTIEQFKDKVTLVLSTPEGEEERIEKELQQYGLVVVGELRPEEYLDDPKEVMALKHKLEIASLEIRQTRQLLEGERQHYGNRIDNLEDQVHFLRRMLDREQYATSLLIESLRSVVSDTTPAARTAIERLVSMVEEGSAQLDANAAVAQLAEAVREDRSILSRLQELLLKGAVQGAAGNYLFAWLQAVAAMFR